MRRKRPKSSAGNIEKDGSWCDSNRRECAGLRAGIDWFFLNSSGQGDSRRIFPWRTIIPNWLLAPIENLTVQKDFRTNDPDKRIFPLQRLKFVCVAQFLIKSAFKALSPLPK